MSKTSFAVLTKARSKFGNRLTEKDYQSLHARASERLCRILKIIRITPRL